MILRCLQTRTGIKFVITAERGNNAQQISGSDMDAVLKEIYVLYTDCVLKDPFYELEMPIRSDLFIQAVDTLIDRVDKLTGGGSNNISSGGATTPGGGTSAYSRSRH